MDRKTANLQLGWREYNVLVRWMYLLQSRHNVTQNRKLEIHSNDKHAVIAMYLLQLIDIQNTYQNNLSVD